MASILLTAGQGARLLVNSLAQTGKERHDIIQFLLDFLLGCLQVSAQHQIFPHRQVGKDAPPFRDQGNALGNRQMGLGGERLALKTDGAASVILICGNSTHQGGFSGAVAADYRNNFPRLHVHGDTLERMDSSVVYLEIFYI